jgi:hypothetical protein
LNEFFQSLGRRYAEEARERGVEMDAPELDAQMALELLELTRVVAHNSERRFAPLSSYLAGIAAERFRAARPEATEAELAQYIEAVRKALET